MCSMTPQMTAPALVSPSPLRVEIRDAVHIHFGGVVEELVDQDRVRLADRSEASTAWAM